MTNQTLKSALLGVVLGVSAVTAQGDVTVGDGFDIDTECNVDIEEGIKVAPGVIEFGDNGNILYSIKDDKHLFVDGKSIDLSSSEAKLVHDYATQIRSDMPKILDIAKEALDIAHTAVSVVFSEVLGVDDRSISKIETAFDLANDKLDQKLNEKDGTYYIGRDGMSVLDDEFDDELEHAVEEAVADGGAGMAWGILKTVFTGGANVEAKVEEKLENKLEIKEEQIEAKADILCKGLIATDELEEKLRASVSELKPYNVFKVSMQKDNTDKTSKDEMTSEQQALVL